MRKTMLIAAALLLGTAGAASAAGNQSGASTLTPGYRMQNSTSSHGASKYTPGYRMRKNGTVGMRGSTKGASKYAPGTTMKHKY